MFRKHDYKHVVKTDEVWPIIPIGDLSEEELDDANLVRLKNEYNEFILSGGVVES